MKKKTLSIILSFRNEENNFEELIKRVSNTVRKLNFHIEIFFINDCSDDNSLSVIKNLQKEYSDFSFKIISTIKRIGVTEGVILGLKECLGDLAVYLDSDLQDPPELIASMVEKWKDGNYIVHTIRKKRKGENFLKVILSSIAYRIINLFSNTLQDAGDFKLIDRKIINYIVNLKNDNLYLKGELSLIEAKNCSIIYEREGRFQGDTHYSLLKSINPYHELLKGIYFNSVKKIISLLFIFNIIFSLIFPILILFSDSIGFFEGIILFLFNLLFYVLIGIIFIIRYRKPLIDENFFYYEK